MADKQIGRPLKIETPQEFEELAEAYFNDCDLRGEPYLWTGLALAVGLTSREALELYAKRPGFIDTVKRARLRVECSYEHRVHKEGQVAGPIFVLKNMGWRDEQTIHNRNMDVSDKPMSADEWEKNNVQ